MRRITASCLVVLVLLLSLPTTAWAANEESVVIVYEDEAVMTDIANLVTACGKTPLALHVDKYQTDMLDGYAYIILLDDKPLSDMLDKGKSVICVGSGLHVPNVKQSIQPERSPMTLNIDDKTQKVQTMASQSVIESYTGDTYGEMTMGDRVYPFAVKSQRITYVPYFSGDDISVMGLGVLLRDYLGQKCAGETYLMIDEVYPYSDLKMLISTADTLYEYGIPFVVGVMPVSENTAYPAYQRYAKVLRYVQSRNGTIVMNDPPVIHNKEDEEGLEVKLKYARGALKDRRVYAYNMQRAYPINMDMIERLAADDDKVITFSVDTVIKTELSTDQQELAELVDRLDKKWLCFGDYRQRFTDKRTHQDDVDVEEAFVYKKKVEQSFGFLFAKGNQILTIIVAASVLIIVTLTIIGYRAYRRKFMKERGET